MSPSLTQSDDDDNRVDTDYDYSIAGLRGRLSSSGSPSAIQPFATATATITASNLLSAHQQQQQALLNQISDINGISISAHNSNNSSSKRYRTHLTPLQVYVNFLNYKGGLAKK